MSKDDLLTEGNLLTLTPMEKYETPKLPTLAEAKPELLKKQPLRWKNKAMILATSLSLLSAVPLSGCTLHHGGSGGGPIYVAYLTEQEAVDLISVQLEAAGLNVAVPLEIYSIRIGSRLSADDPVLVLVDEENNLNIVLVGRRWRERDRDREQAIEQVKEQFEADFGIAIDAVFFSLEDEIWSGNVERRTARFRREFEADLSEQVQEFIQHLQEQGLIE